MTKPTPFAAPLAGPLRRSLINSAVETAREVAARFEIGLPAHAFWEPRQWEAAGADCQEVRDCMLGWDVTDFGSGRFEAVGRTLFTLRNGRSNDARYPKPYAEKLLFEAAGQRSPLHYHRAKREDIINRAGGNVLIRLHKIAPDGQPQEGSLSAQIDGCTRTVQGGDLIRLRRGESLTIPPGTFHQFWAEEGTGVEIGGLKFTVSTEVSSVCDDWNDNVFIDEGAARFPRIQEDEPRRCYLCHEYPASP